MTHPAAPAAPQPRLLRAKQLRTTKVFLVFLVVDFAVIVAFFVLLEGNVDRQQDIRFVPCRPSASHQHSHSGSGRESRGSESILDQGPI
jgi:hypothetical protein